MATTQTIVLIGRALVELGVPVTVLHCGPHPYLKSIPRAGESNGIAYRYLGPTTRRPTQQYLRGFLYLAAYIELAYVLTRMCATAKPVPTALCVHVQGRLLNAYISLLSCLLRLPVIIEACEWEPEIPGTSKVVCWIYQKLMFRFSAGAIVISRSIQERILALRVHQARPYPMYRRPALVDPSEFLDVTRGPAGDRRLVWCGDVTGYLRDVLFLIAVTAALRDSVTPCTLEVVGPVSADSMAAIMRCCEHVGLPTAQLRILGYVKRDDLLRICQTASALIQPLWDDARSKTRLPNKLGEFLMSGRPVVTCSIGDVGEYLTDGENAVFYQPGDVVNCAQAIATLLSDPVKARAIGLAGRAFAEQTLSYKQHGAALVRLFAAVAK
jgi:glycosyltransferase involved in cell wall biosynthesis